MAKKQKGKKKRSWLKYAALGYIGMGVATAIKESNAIRGPQDAVIAVVAWPGFFLLER